MCVIIACVNKKGIVTLPILEGAELANGDGGGIAWLDNAGAACWKKGIKATTIWRLIKEHKIAPPYVVHFRIATAGAKSRELCHPFPVTEDATLALSGAGPHPLLFHNGHWTSWRSMVLQAALTKPKLPDGDWSDSRAMAWLAHHCGLSVLAMVDEKIAALDPIEAAIRFFGTGWSEYRGMWVSNQSFAYRTDYIESENKKGRKGKGKTITIPLGPSIPYDTADERGYAAALASGEYDKRDLTPAGRSFYNTEERRWVSENERRVKQSCPSAPIGTSRPSLPEPMWVKLSGGSEVRTPSYGEYKQLCDICTNKSNTHSICRPTIAPATNASTIDLCKDCKDAFVKLTEGSRPGIAWRVLVKAREAKSNAIGMGAVRANISTRGILISAEGQIAKWSREQEKKLARVAGGSITPAPAASASPSELPSNGSGTLAAPTREGA